MGEAKLSIKGFDVLVYRLNQYKAQSNFRTDFFGP